MTQKRIVIAGGSGLIGSALAEALRARGDTVVSLVRSAPETGKQADTFVWGPRTGGLDPAALEGADAVVVLSGVPIAGKRWTEERKALILSSRTDSVGTVARTMAAMDNPPPVLLASSAIGFYGERGDDVLTEDEPSGVGFFADVCSAWEGAARPAKAAGVRVVNMRTGIVMSGNGGALDPMLPLFKLGIGGRIGNGKQWWSWVSEEDCVRAFLHCIGEDIRGPVNVVSPNPVTNAQFTKALGKAVHRPTLLPTPKFGLTLRLGSELAEAVGYVSHRVEPAVLKKSGFTFTHETIDTALKAALA